MSINNNLAPIPENQMYLCFPAASSPGSPTRNTVTSDIYVDDTVCYASSD